MLLDHMIYSYHMQPNPKQPVDLHHTIRAFPEFVYFEIPIYTS